MGANDAMPPLPAMHVDIVMTQELYAELQRQQRALELARAFKIEGSEEEQVAIATEANTQLRDVKATITMLVERKKKFTEPAKKIVAEAEAMFDPAIEALRQAETYLKAELSDFTTRQQQRINDARRAQQEEERQRRVKADQAAAIARAKAEEDARQRDREAREAEERRLAAEREGNAKAAREAAAAKAKAEEQAKAAREKGETKAQQVELAAAAQPGTVVVPEDTKIAGFSTRENYVAELAAGMDEDRAKVALVGAIASDRTDLLPLLKIDMAAANRLAKAQKKNMNAPGLIAVNKPVAASRG